MDNQQFVQSAKIALLIDFDNVILGVEDPGFDVELVVNTLRSRGIVVMGRAYGDWYRHHRHRRKLMEQGIELVETPAFGPLIKNSADIRIVIDGLDIAAAHAHIDTFCLVSGDSDFLPLIKRLQLLGKNVIVIAGNKFTSDLVRRNCNEYVSYENLLAESVGATEDATSLEGAFHLLGRAINTLEERGMDVRSSAVKQMMLQLNPVFSERTFGCYQFKQFLDRATRAGLVALHERDNNGEHSVELRDKSAFPSGEDIPEVKVESSTRSAPVAPSTPSSNGARESLVRDNFAPEKNARERMRDSSRSGRRFGKRDKDESSTIVEAPAENVTQSETPKPAFERTAPSNGAISASALESRPGVRRGRLRFSAKSGGVETQAAPTSSTREADNETILDVKASSEPLSSNVQASEVALEVLATAIENTPDVAEEAAPKKRASRSRRGKAKKTESPTETSDEVKTDAAPVVEPVVVEPAVVATSSTRSRTSKAKPAKAVEVVAAAPEDASIEAMEELPDDKKKTSRGRRGGAKRTAAKRAKTDGDTSAADTSVADAPVTDA